MNRIFVLSAAVVLIIGAAVYQGMTEGRWYGRGANAEVQAFAARLDKVPFIIGDWEGKDDDVDPQILQVAGIVGAVSRTYKHRYTPDTVSIFLVCADRRAVSTHTPDKCYLAAGFRVADYPQPYHLAASSLSAPVGEKTDEQEYEVTLLNSAFVKEEPTGTQRLRVFWAWSKDGDWVAPEGDSRWALQGGDAWYKLYIMTSEQADGHGNLQLDQSPCVKFARDFLPVAQDKLFETPAPAGTPTAGGEQAVAEPAPAPTT
jgi:hypothetical protein